tara:strand:+ start:129 stop:797 length:669 start_codon:yes stop_codon:yes gene_type:complete
MIDKKRFKLKNNDGIPIWLEEFYNKYLPDSGFFVEVGVGHTIDRHWTAESTILATQESTVPSQRCGSNTLDLLDYDFSGVYIDPIKEFCDELSLITRDKDIEILNFGCSDLEEELSLFGGETFRANHHTTWPGGVDYIGRKVQCKPLSLILDELNVSRSIDLMSIDVEGWEMKVLKGLREEHMPKIMIIEINKSFEIWNELEQRGYTCYYRDKRDAAFMRKI